MTVTSSSGYRTNTIYYPKSNNYLTSTKTMEPATSTSSLARMHHVYSVFSPPDLVHDDEEEDEEDPTPLPASPPTTPPSCLIMNQHRILKSSISASPITKHRKRIPHRSPSPPLTTTSNDDWIFTWPSSTIVTSTAPVSPQLLLIPQHEQQYQHYSYQPRIVYLRHRINNVTPRSKSSSSLEQPLQSSSSFSSSLQFSNQSAFTTVVASRINQQSTATSKSVSSPTSSSLSTTPISQSSASSPIQQPLLPSSSTIPFHHHQPSERDSMYADMTVHKGNLTVTTVTNTNSAFSSGRPIRLKGPCQACHENSEACMRKAFNWPFPSDEVYYDKGRPFVYLCNKCGLRYNKSGGSVCRQCRWVLCKEEKRKVIQLIDTMRSSRADGHISLDEDITSFVCTPKYWNCGQPWKIRWVLNSDDGGKTMT